MDLFDGTAQLPDWLPDETVYSWACRFHALAGHRLPSQTSRVLFGGDRRGAQHDLPTGLAVLTERAGGRLGAAQEIALTRTVVGYYLAARAQSEAVRALACLSGPTAQGLKFRLGLLTSRFRANHPLKACRICMREDRQTHGVAYWHLRHQYPGTWVCLRHRSPLLTASIKSNGVDRFGWVLPDTSGLQPAFNDDLDITPFLRLAEFVQGWASLPPAALTVISVAETCRRNLLSSEARGSQGGRLSLAEDYARSLVPLRHVSELSPLPSTAAAARAELNRWLFAPRGNTHPLRLLALIAWLFDDWRAFITATHAAFSERPTASEAVAPREVTASEQLFAHVLSTGVSITTASRLAGVTVNTGIAWAARMGQRVARRPKQVEEVTHQRILKALRRGEDKGAIASRYRVSVQTVTRALRSEPGLSAQRRLAIQERTRKRARSDWAAALERWPAMTQKELRSHVGAAFSWLYRHDREWLMSNQPLNPIRSRPSPRVDWDARDAALATAVQRVACELAEGGDVLPVPLWQVFKALPELKAKLGSLGRLPLTRSKLQEVARTKRRKVASSAL